MQESMKNWKLVSRSFAQVVNNEGADSLQQTSEDNSVCVTVKVDSTRWLKDCFVGRLYD